MKSIFRFLLCYLPLSVMTVVALIGSARADFTITHSGATDPATEGFAGWPGCYGAVTVGPVYGDMGYNAWSIMGLTQSQQAYYYSEPLSTSQQGDIANQGFVLAVVERVLQNMAPAYTPDNPAVVSLVAASTGSSEFVIYLGVNGNGETVVVLPTSIDQLGQGGSVRAFGPSFTLTGSGSGYHTYQLIYHPITQLTDLFVDGTEHIQGYAGLVNNPDPTAKTRYSSLWGGLNGGQANFNTVQLTSSAASTPPPSPVPALSTPASLLLVAGLGVILWRGRDGKPRVLIDSRVALTTEDSQKGV